MKIYSPLAVTGLLAISSSAVIAEPTRTFFTETAEVAAQGAASLDLDYAFTSDGFGTGVRFGAAGGEIQINAKSVTDPSGFRSTSIGYKRILQPQLAAYGVLSYTNDAINAPGPGNYSATDFALGLAYTMQVGANAQAANSGITLNFNVELVTDDEGLQGRGAETTLFAKAAAVIPTNQLVANTDFIVEVGLEDSDVLDTQASLGFRWQPAKNITTDLIVYADDGDPVADPATGIPGYVKVNIAF